MYNSVLFKHAVKLSNDVHCCNETSTLVTTNICMSRDTRSTTHQTCTLVTTNTCKSRDTQLHTNQLFRNDDNGRFLLS